MKGPDLKAPRFDYRLVRTRQEALAALAQTDSDVRVLAGGQSLVAALNLRLSQPDLLIDVSRIPEWKGVRLAANELIIGALTTHAEIARSQLVAQTAPLLAAAAPFIAHPAIRNRGTIGGSVCLADPAAEWPACLVALGATMIVERVDGTRAIPARSFFKGLYETALEPGEILTAIKAPVRAPDEIHLFDEFARRPGDFALAGLAMSVRFEKGRIAALHLGFLGLAGTPVSAPGFAEACVGLSAEEAGALARESLAGELDPSGDHHASADYRARLAEVLTRRLLSRAAAQVERSA